MKRAIVIAALAACGHGATTRGPEHDLDRPGSNAPVADSPAAPTTAPDAPAPGPAVPAIADDGPHAFVAEDRGLVEVARSGKAQLITATKPAWCSADDRAQVVWFTGDDGLYAFDLGDRRVHKVVAGQLETDTVMIDWGKEQLGGENKLDYQVALGLRMTTPPKVSNELGCDGDQADYCYEEDGQTLHAELVAKQKHIDGLAIADPAYVASLVARGKDRSLWTRPPAPPAAPAKKPKVDRKACEENPKDCGALIALPASPLWLVVTANSRGDFYHETRELWDPATGEYVAVANGALVRSKKPQGGDRDYRDLRIAPDGTMSIDGVVFDPQRVLYVPKGDLTTTCGWSNGGWRIGAGNE